MQKRQENTGIALSLFYSYAHEDEAFRKELETHLAQLRRQGLIAEWYDREILAGTVRGNEIDAHLQTASIILLLISPDFLASDYCYDIEMHQALERHKLGEVHIIPIILRPCDWRQPPIDTLQALPTGDKPVTLWANRDEAWLDVEQGIRKVVRTLLSQESRPIPPFSSASSSTATPVQTVPSPSQITQAQQRLSPREAPVQPVKYSPSGESSAAFSPVAENEEEHEILRRIRNNDVPTSWKVFRPAKKPLLWHSITYYCHLYECEETVFFPIFFVVTILLLVLIGVTAALGFLVPIGFGILLITMGCVIGILSWRTATKSVLVITPDRFLWGNWEKERLEKVFRFRDYTSLGPLNLAMEKQLQGIRRGKLIEREKEREGIPLPSLFEPAQYQAQAQVALLLRAKAFPWLGPDNVSLFESSQPLAWTIHDAHRQFLRSNQGKPGTES